jgi:putative transposase
MIKARHKQIRVSHQDALRLRELQHEAARCWNAIVAEAKAHYDDGNGWISKTELQKRMKGRFALHSQTVQGLTDRFCSNRKTAAENRRLGLDTRYPWRTKKFVTVPFKEAAIRLSPTGTVVLSLKAGDALDTGLVLPPEATFCQLLWSKGRYVLSYTAEFPVKDLRENGLRAGIDIGEIHPVALCAEDGTGLVISGREVRSVKRRRNKSLGKFARMLSRCKKGSRRWKKLRRARGRMKSKTDCQVRDLLHQATRKAIRWCEDHAVAELVIGNPAGVEKNTKKQRRLSRRVRQKISQMETGRIKHYLRYKAEEAGIATCLTEERGTSSECPCCGHSHKPKGRTFRCPQCGFVSHRDGKAAFMMIRKNHDVPLPESFRIDHRQAVPKYRKRSVIGAACVDGPDKALSSLARAESLPDERLVA